MNASSDDDADGRGPQSFSLDMRWEAVLWGGLTFVLVAVLLAITILPVDGAERAPWWLVLPLWLVALLPLRLLWYRFWARRYRDAIQVTREGIHPVNEATGLIPWAAIDRIILIEQPVLSGTRSTGHIIQDKSFVIYSRSMHLFRSRLGPADFLPPSRRRLPHDPTALLVIATLVHPTRGKPPGYLRLLASIRRFKPVEHMVWDTSAGAWQHWAG